MQFCKGYDVYRFEYGLLPDDYGTLSYYAWTLYRLIPFVCVFFHPPSNHLSSNRTHLTRDRAAGTSCSCWLTGRRRARH
jgi:hypothetical protein